MGVLPTDARGRALPFMRPRCGYEKWYPHFDDGFNPTASVTPLARSKTAATKGGVSASLSAVCFLEPAPGGPPRERPWDPARNIGDSPDVGAAFEAAPSFLRRARARPW